MEDDKMVDFMRGSKKFADETSAWLTSSLQMLGWDEDHILQDAEKRKCPVDESHMTLASSCSRHVECCRLRKEGYDVKEMEKMCTPKKYYSNYKNIVTVNIGEAALGTILARTRPGLIAGGRNKRDMPQNPDRESVEFNPAERHAMYEYCIETAKAANGLVTIAPEELTMLDMEAGDSKPKSELEQLAMERDMKRRRQSYKGKSTHTGKKNHLEVIRDVIDNQTERLGRIWQSRMECDLTNQLRSARQESEHLGRGDEYKNSSNGRNSGRQSPNLVDSPRGSYRESRSSNRRSRSRSRDRHRDRRRERDDHHSYERRERHGERFERREERNERHEERSDGDRKERHSRKNKNRDRSRDRSRSRHRSQSKDRSGHREKHKHKKHKKSKHRGHDD